MVSTGYREWLTAGRPYTLVRPARAVQAALRGHGLTVYDYPNDAHLQANTPEDHTPFSVTGWPGKNPRWNARALDVMPRSDSAAHRKENADLARQIIRDRDAGYPGAMWVKYLNWTDEKGKCRQERWMNSARPLERETRDSNDRGHIHLSGRSDIDNDTRADGYDPFARMNGEEDMSLGEEVNWGQQFTWEGYDPADGPWLGGTLGNQLQHMRETGFFTKRLALRTAARVEAVAALLEQVLAAGGGDFDVAALMAHVDTKLEALAAETRDAVADLGEGGAAQVRADAG